MSPRTRPVACIGQVNILAPTQSNPYYRLTWLRLDGKQGRTSSTSLDGAKQKAAGIDADLNHEGARLGSATLEEIVTHYVSSPVGRNQKTQGANWKPLQLEMITDKLASALRGHETVVARDLNRTILDQMRSAAGTYNTRKQIATALRGMLRWGYSTGYFTPEQAELLPVNLVDLEGTVKGTEAPKRVRGIRAAGQGEGYVRDEDAPSLVHILTLRGRFDAAFPLWGALAVELSHATGLRWGEQFQLTAHDVLDQRGDEDPSVLVRVDWQINSAAKRRDPEPVFRE